MSKQTATEYLIQEIKNDALVQAKSTEEWNKIFQIALQMEREQIQDAFYHGVDIDAFNVNNKWTEAEKYYKQNFTDSNE